MTFFGFKSASTFFRNGHPILYLQKEINNGSRNFFKSVGHVNIDIRFRKYFIKDILASFYFIFRTFPDLF